MTHRKTIKGHLEGQASCRMASDSRQTGFSEPELKRSNERDSADTDDKLHEVRSYGVRKSFYERYPEYKSQHWVDEVRGI